MKRKKSYGTRTLAALLCAGMLAGMMPTAALAQEEPVVPEQSTALATGETAEPNPNTLPTTQPDAQGTPAPSEEPAAEAETYVATATSLATTAGTLPAGIDWAEGVDAQTFATPYATVKAKDKAGTEYTVEVVPENTVYFIDNANVALATTEPYAAVKALVGDALLNQTFDQLKTGDATWGRVNTDAQNKKNDSTADKTNTGIYAAGSGAGNTLSYDLTLPAGTYTITSAHREWWKMTRPMDVSLTTGKGTTKIASITVHKDAVDATATGTFTLDAEETVRYTITSTGKEAPVLSWLAVAKAAETTPTDPADWDGVVLEDSGKVSTYDGAKLIAGKTSAKAVEINKNWVDIKNSTNLEANSKVGGAFLTDGDNYAKRTAFTLYFDVNTAEQSEKGGAFTIGNAAHNVTLIGNNAGKRQLKISGVAQDLGAAIPLNAWQSVAAVYSENETTGTIALYLSGEELLAPTELGFKLSEQSDNIVGFGNAFATGFMAMGEYDNIVMRTTAATAEEAKAETAARVAAWEGVVGYDEMVTVNGDDVDTAAANLNGLTYKGWGMLNGNSTSNLLMDYKAENPAAYWEMMNYLFGGEHPLFTHIKMELGNDGNNSTGPDACTMRTEDEEADVSRSPGFAMAADAKKINPDVKISMLRWEIPTWVKNYWNGGEQKTKGYEAMYKWYKETIFDAYEKYGYVLDFVNPDKNETGDPNEDFIKWFTTRVENEGDFPAYFTDAAKDAYHNIRIIASDENKGLNIVPSMRADAELYDDVDIIGFHYRTNANDDYVKMADVDDKEVWYSEGCATFGYSELQENKTTEYGANSIGGYQGPLALVDSMITSFVSSRRSHYIFQPALGSFYEGIQYGHKELLSARDPWSGYIHYDPALQMIAHFSRFATTGWEDSDPSQNEIWRMIAGASDSSFAGTTNEHATAGINGNAGYLTLAAPDKTNFSTVIVNNTQNPKTFCVSTENMSLAENAALHIWETATDSYMKDKGTVEQENGRWVVTIAPYTVNTLTTLDEYTEEQLAMPKTGINTEDRTVLDTDKTGKTADTSDNVLYADDFEYDEEADLDVYNEETGKTTKTPYLESRGNEPRYFLDTHAAWTVEDGRLCQALPAAVDQWNGGDPATMVGDFRWMNYTAAINVQIPDAAAGTWAGLGVRSQRGMSWNDDAYTLRIYGNGNWEFYRAGSKLGNGSVAANAEGKYALSVAALDNTIVALIDGVSVYQYTDESPMDAGRVKLSSSWNKVYFDDLSVTTIPGSIPYATSMVDGQDDTVSYEGTWAINNPGGGSADDWYRTLSTTSTANSAFTFSFPVAGTGFSILGANSAGTVLDVYVDNELKAENAQTIATGKRYATYTLTGLENAKHTVKVVVKSGALTVDAFYTLGEKLAGGAVCATSINTDLPKLLAVKTGESVTDLPQKVEVLYSDNSTKMQAITWKTSGKDFDTGSVTGTVADAKNAFGLPLTVNIPVEIVPVGTIYFIDAVDAAPKADATTEPFAAVKALLGKQLLNTVSDQLKTADTTWGLVDTDAGTKSYTTTTNKTDTGIYGHDNKKGETLSYDLALEAGTYTITSAHREWWGMARPMDLTLTTDEGVLPAGNAALSGNTPNITNSFTFTIKTAQTVRYTITATGNQAPAISWLAVTDSSIKPTPPTPTPPTIPTATPTGSPSATPTGSPSATPTGSPTATPTGSPTATPTGSPTAQPSAIPSEKPSTSPPTPPLTPPLTPPQTYPMLEGAGQSVAPGSEGTFRAEIPYEDFTGVQMDGQTVDPSNYDSWSGSTFVRLKASYVSTLSAGDHTLTILGTDGAARTTFTVAATTEEGHGDIGPAIANGTWGQDNNKNGGSGTAPKATAAPAAKIPQTSDAMGTTLTICLFLASIALVGAGLCIYRKRRNNH